MSEGRRILSIDPGSERSGWIIIEGDAPKRFGKTPNDDLLAALRGPLVGSIDVVVIEWSAPRGMPASIEFFEALWWSGRFAEACRPVPVERVERSLVKRHLCGTTAAKDANVRAALIDRYGGIGGKEAAIGRKASPGPLHGLSADVWAALAVGVTYQDLNP